MESLPIEEVLSECLEQLRVRPSLVLQAPPGAGKTTRVPPALCGAFPQFGSSPLPNGRIVMVQPRRLATRTAAARIAAENGWEVGKQVGYQHRFERRASADTQIMVVTEGILLRQLQLDPCLSDIACVILDEFHERRLDTDLLLGMLRRVQETIRPELRIVVMSATLDSTPIATYLNDCPVVRSQGKAYPVQIRYSPINNRLGNNRPPPLAQQISPVILKTLESTEGDILVFLPGVGEILSTIRELENESRSKELLLLPLYADLAPEEQDRALAKSSKRKVVLATNVAETSITIDGIRVVIDSGLARVMRQDPQVGIDRLQLEPISKASSDQRAGRAGRTAPGICIRLWDEPTQRSRPEFTDPEIRRIDLASAVLQLYSWGEKEISVFPWLEAPRPEAVNQSIRVLQLLGALHGNEVTAMGRRMVELPTHPRLARMMLESLEFGHLDAAALAAALISERDPFDRRNSGPGRQPPTRQRSRSDSDLLDRVEALYEFFQTGKNQFDFGMIKTGGAHQIARSAEQLYKIASKNAGSEANAVPPTEPCSVETGLGKALLAAFPDRLARRRDPGKPRALMVGGRGVKLAPDSAVRDAEFFVCVDLADDGSSEAIARMASAVPTEWLDGELITFREELFFHPSQLTVVARKRRYWDDLMLEETPVAASDSEAVATLLAKEAMARFDQLFPKDDSTLTNLIARIRFLASVMPEAEFPKLERSEIEAIVRELCVGRRSIAELRNAPWHDLILGSLTQSQVTTLHRNAPERFELPSGIKAKIVYEEGKPPVLAARIQDFFGLSNTPTIAGGRIKLLLHLLAPSQRCQQITDDLASFWRNTYTTVKKELKRRYPKHAWPDDPLAKS